MENLALALQNSIDEIEFDYYGARAHRCDAVVGQSLGNSYVWVDGECTGEELDGICALQIKSVDDLNRAVSTLRKMYCWDNEQIVLVGCNSKEYGVDDGEIIMRDNICIAISAN